MSYRSFNGRFTTRANFARELSEHGITIEEYEVLNKRETIERKNLGLKPSLDKAFKKLLSDYIEVRENGFNFEEQSKDFIEMLSNYQRNKGKAYYNNKRLSKNELAKKLQHLEQGLAFFYPKIVLKNGDFYFNMNEKELEQNTEEGGSHYDSNGNSYMVSSKDTKTKEEEQHDLPT